MTPHDHMRKQMRKVAGGGIAWERRTFTQARNHDANTLLDAAVDIAWERLMPNALERSPLDVRDYGNFIVFRVRRATINQLLHATA